MSESSKKSKENPKMDEKKQDKKKIDKTKQELEEANQKIIDLTNTLQRLQADFENYKKRNESEKEGLKSLFVSSFVAKLLPLLDNFELGLKNSAKHEDFVKGMEIIYSQFIDILKHEKIEKIKAVDEQFDPKLHEAMMAVESDQKPNTVIEEFQSGYVMGERVIRHAKVKVAK